MEGSRHKGVVVRRVAEYYQLGAAQGILILGGLGCLQHHLSHQAYRVHVQSALGGSHIDGAAHPLCGSQSLRNGTDQKLVCSCHALGYQRGISADKVDAHLSGRLVKCLRNADKICLCFTGAAAHQSDRSNGNSLIYNGNAKLASNCVSCGDQISGVGGDFPIDLFIELFHSGGRAV